ncbi:MAG: HdeD family acid-resistance protein [Gammaproteobacteria bacterium]
MNDITNLEIRELQERILAYLQKHWKLFFAEGLIFVILGLCAIVVPQLFTLGITLFLGWLIFFGGLIQIARAIVFFRMPGFGVWLFLGILQATIGYLLIADPTQGALTLTMLLTLLFAFEGIAKIFWAMMLRPLANWGWILFSGLTALIFATVVWASWPETAHWLLGLFLGINMVFLGWALIRISIYHRMPF